MRGVAARPPAELSVRPPRPRWSACGRLEMKKLKKSSFSPLHSCIIYVIIDGMKAKPGNVGARKAPFTEVAAGLMPVARGSLALVRKACGKPGCRACKSGRKHPAWLFVYREGGKQKSRHVPAQCAKPMKRAIENGRKLEQAICAEGLAYLDSLVAEAAK